MPPEPLTLPDCDLRDYPWMPLDVRRLLTSVTWMDGPAEGKVAALSLWCEAWCQVPAGSLPDNDRILSHLSQAGAAWKRVRDHALRGWIKCSDGRLYHPVVAEKAREAWDMKLAQRRRTEAARRAKMERRDGKPTESAAPPSTTPVTDKATEPATTPVAKSVTETVTGSTVHDMTYTVPNGTDAAPPTPPPSAVDLLWQQGLPIVAHLLGKRPDQCRAFLGKLRGNLDDDCPRLLLILQQAQQMRPTDPVAWLTAATGAKRAVKPSRDEQVLRAAGLWNDEGYPTIEHQPVPRGMLQ